MAATTSTLTPAYLHQRLQQQQRAQSQQQTSAPRASTETDRQHLLASETASLAPSDSASLFSHPASSIAPPDGERTPRAHSPARRSTITLPATDAPESRDGAPFKGFASEGDYLAFLEAWAESKRYVEVGTPVVGFYGERTLRELASKAPPPGLGLREKWRRRRESRGVGVGAREVGGREGEREAERERRGTVA